MRARRVHQGERTQSEALGDRGVIVQRIAEATDEPREGLEVPAGRAAELTVHEDGTSEARLLPEGTELSNEPTALEAHAGAVDYRHCGSCTKVYGDRQDPVGEYVAPSDTLHLSDDGNVTLCGREMGDGWTSP